MNCDDASGHIPAGAVAVTIPALLGAEAVEYRVRDSGAKALVVDGGLLPKLRGGGLRVWSFSWLTGRLVLGIGLSRSCLRDLA
jgi:hypothetical protein